MWYVLGAAVINWCAAAKTSEDSMSNRLLRMRTRRDSESCIRTNLKAMRLEHRLSAMQKDEVTGVDKVKQNENLMLHETRRSGPGSRWTAGTRVCRGFVTRNFWDRQLVAAGGLELSWWNLTVKRLFQAMSCRD